MDKKEFNKSLDKYISERRQFRGSLRLSDIRAKVLPNRDKIKTKTKFKETDVKIIEKDEKPARRIRKPFLARMFCCKKKAKIDVADEEINMVTEETNINVKNDKNSEEFDAELAEIEKVDHSKGKKKNIFQSMGAKMGLCGKSSKKDYISVNEESEFSEEIKSDIKDDLKIVIDFSIEALKLLPAKDFEWLKDKESFKKYKAVIKRHMPSAAKKDKPSN